MRTAIFPAFLVSTGLWIVAITTPVSSSASWFEPTRVQSSPGPGFTAPFTMRLLNNAFGCADRFDSLSVDISGNRITLTYRDSLDTGIVICPLVMMDYGPSFSISPLAPGYYEVYENIYSPPCGPTCGIPAPPVYVGLLAVADDISWSMRPDTVDANTPFTLDLPNYAYGNCFVGFSHLSYSVTRSGAIFVTFTPEYYPMRNCLVDLHPSGPSFPISGLPAGIEFAVYAVEQPACVYDSIPCGPAMILSQFVDSLVVRPAAAIMPGRHAKVRFDGVFPKGVISGYRMDGRKTDFARRKARQ